MLNNWKILILANSAGGLYHFRFELVKMLLSQNFSVVFCVPNPKDDIYVQKFIEAGAVFIHTPMNRRSVNPFSDNSLIKSYTRIVKDLKPDVILTYTVKPNIYGNYVAAKFKIPVLMNVTGIGTSMISHRLRSIIKLMYKYACTKAEKVFFQNSSNLDFFLKNKLVRNKKTKLLPGSGVNLQNFQPLEKTISDGKIRFLFIGRLMKEKGVEELLKAARNVILKYPDAVFQLVGGMEEEKYKTYTDKNKNIEFLGRSDDVRVQIREADCIINPSYHEGMSNVLQEGAAMGKPLLASNIPGCREIVEDGVNGFLFESKDANDIEEKIVKFIELSEEKRSIMGRNSRSKVEKEFDRSIVVEEYMNAVKTVISGK